MSLQDVMAAVAALCDQPDTANRILNDAGVLDPIGIVSGSPVHMPTSGLLDETIRPVFAYRVTSAVVALLIRKGVSLTVNCVNYEPSRHLAECGNSGITCREFAKL